MKTISNKILIGIIISFLMLTTSVKAIELPGSFEREEIKCQLLELAVANIDKKFIKQYIKLVKSQSSNEEKYASELAKSFFIIKKFRDDYFSYTWTQRQNLEFIPTIVRITPDEMSWYKHLIESKELRKQLILLRPKTAIYLEYRKKILELLRQDSNFLYKYPYEVINKKSYGDKVLLLKKTLFQKGVLGSDEPIDGVYTLNLENAIKKFQKENLIADDGIVGLLTYNFLFMSNEEKAVRLARSILRLNDVSMLGEEKYILVNIPDLKMRVYEQGKSIFDSTIVVGRKDRPTPRIFSFINNVVLNPTWTVPPTIVKDYLKALRHDRLYLVNKGIDIIDYHGEVVDPLLLSNKDLTEKSFKKYRLVQQPGVENALGLYKFNFPNKDDVYLHSTSTPSAFKKQSRLLSSGCVRVEKSHELAVYLLKGTLYNDKKINHIIEKGDTKWVPLKNKVPIYIAYWTAYIGGNNKVYFRPDVYEIDSSNYKLPLGFIEIVRSSI
ncbi:MAG: L,D-transpeptidase family protein [Succinivibrionaceae bacterium]